MNGFRITGAIILARSLADDIAAALVASVSAGDFEGPLNGLFLRFYTNDYTPTPDMILANFTDAALGGAPGVEITAWEGPINLPNDQKGLKFEAQLIAGAGPTEENLVGAYIYLPGPPDVPKGALRFAEAVPIAAEDDAVSLDLVVPVPMIRNTGLAA